MIIDGTEVKLCLSTYVEGEQKLFLGLLSKEDDGEDLELFCDITVNIGEVPAYCGYVDINNMPSIEDFIREYELGTFTGLMKRSGYCEYPLYLFDCEKLKEMCPDEMNLYEAI